MKPLVSMNFDCCGGLWAGADYRSVLVSLLEKCSTIGVSRVMYRTSACGQVYYPSAVMTQVYGHADIEIARKNREWVGQGDPFRIFCEEARRFDLEPWAWITAFDSYYVGLEDPFFVAHPELLMTSRPQHPDQSDQTKHSGLAQRQDSLSAHDGPRALRGIPCYAEPEIVEYRLKEAREVAAYDIAGIFYSLRSHSSHVRCKKDIQGLWTYGYNDPVVQRCKQLYGVDIRKEKLDSDALCAVHGEFYGSFLRKVRDELHGRGQRIAAMADPKGWRGYVWDNEVMIATPWNDWLASNTVDEVVLESGHELICDSLVDKLDLEFKQPERTSLWVYESHKASVSGDEIVPALRTCSDKGLRGITVHEAAWFRVIPELWEYMRDGVGRYCR